MLWGYVSEIILVIAMTTPSWFDDTRKICNFGNIDFEILKMLVTSNITASVSRYIAYKTFKWKLIKELLTLNSIKIVEVLASQPPNVHWEFEGGDVDKAGTFFIDRDDARRDINASDSNHVEIELRRFLHQGTFLSIWTKISTWIKIIE